ncbi:Hsp20/alpha crystallin family protein [Georgenia sp. SYP-B2076]|uniref:Hsp20/alpha crystallin family protein n=1 Tax=Georgenia sp. SYP-B2076 TaxID=2495881 RepID=UPI001F0C8A9D|nr:Hsp20/alpha crystallin family protein [Georgenia sp. SYP-B2076]
MSTEPNERSSDVPAMPRYPGATGGSGEASTAGVPGAAGSGTSGTSSTGGAGGIGGESGTSGGETGRSLSESGTTGAPARRSPREMAEHLWDAWPFGDIPWPFREAGRAGGAPIRVEEYTDGDELVVRAEIPGVDPEKDIDVTVDEGVLTISAQRKEKTESKRGGGFRSEFRYGHFERQVRLPRGTSSDVIRATYRDGVLEVRLPAPTEEPTTRRIQIQRG